MTEKHGEAAGHAFRGNQHVSVGAFPREPGEKPGFEDFDNAETSQHVKQILDDLGAIPVTGMPGVYLADGKYGRYGTGRTVIEWDGEDAYPSLTDAEEWVGNADVGSIVAELEDRFNSDFWSSPPELFHETSEENVESVMSAGLLPSDKTRGISNRGTGPAVFTFNNSDELSGSYGDSVIRIDTKAMLRDGVTPFASMEGPITENEARSALAHRLGVEWRGEPDSSDGLSESTVILHGKIESKYLGVYTETDRHGEGQGHPFRGNQHVSIGSPSASLSRFSDDDTASHRSAIEDFGNNDFHFIRRVMEGRGPKDKDASEKARVLLEAFENDEVVKTVASPVTVFRGLVADVAVEEEFSKLSPGDSFSDKSFAAASFSKSIPEMIMKGPSGKGRSVSLHLKLATGVKYLPGRDDEKELILKPGQRFTVVSSKRIGKELRVFAKSSEAISERHSSASSDYEFETLGESDGHPFRGNQHVKVDGFGKTDKKRLAPGDPQRDANFKKWFADSKVVDEDGKPMVIYHGTSSKFDSFQVSDHGKYGPGIYMSTSPKEASDYAESRKYRPDATFNADENVIPVFASIKNPLVITDDDFGWGRRGSAIRGMLAEASETNRTLADVASDAGFDGIIDKGFGFVVAFDPRQVKSATGNRGTFSSKDKRVTHSEQDDLELHGDKPGHQYRGNQYTGTFRPLDPQVSKWIQKHTATEVKRTFRDGRDAIREAVSGRLSGRISMNQAANRIIDYIGLNKTQVRAVEKFSTLLEERGEKPMIVARESSRYAAELLRSRAMTIAAVELKRAESAAKRLAWKQMQDDGILPAGVKRRWDRLNPEDACEICVGLDGQIVNLDEPFVWDGIEYDGPPDPHPNCMCGLKLVTVDEEDDQELESEIEDPLEAEEHGEGPGHPFRGNQHVKVGAALSPGTPERDANFKKWFEGSKVVDKNGDPIVMYHGTNTDFDEFKDTRFGGHFFTDSSRLSYSPIQVEGGASSVKSVYLSIKNPMVSEEQIKPFSQWDAIRRAKSLGHDGIVYPDEFGSTTWIAFSSSQIKSATGNRGTFDPEDPRITHGEGPGHAFRGNQHTGGIGGSADYEWPTRQFESANIANGMHQKYQRMFKLEERVSRYPGEIRTDFSGRPLIALSQEESSEYDALKSWADKRDADSAEMAKADAAASPVAEAMIKAGTPELVPRRFFVAYHNTGYISSDTYKRYEESGFDYIHKEKFVEHVDTVDVNGKPVEIRVEHEPVQYVKTDASGEIVRDDSGLATYLTRDEIASRGLPYYSSTVAGFHGDTPVGYSGDEFGATGVYVQKDFQRSGLGVRLLKTYLERSGKLARGVKIGQMTDRGAMAVAGLHKALVKDALAVGKRVPASVLADYPDLSKSTETHGEGPGHAFRGNQHTGGIGGTSMIAAKNLDSAAPWSSQDPRYKSAVYAVNRAQNLFTRMHREGTSKLRLSQFLTMDPETAKHIGPVRLARVAKDAERLLEIMRSTGMDRDKLRAAFTADVDRQFGGTYRNEEVDRLIAEGADLKEALGYIANLARTGSAKSKAIRKMGNAVAEQMNSEYASKLPGVDDVKQFKTAKAAADSLSDIAWDPKTHSSIPKSSADHYAGPRISFGKVDPKIASMMAAELRDFHDEFPDDFARLGYFGPAVKSDRQGKGAMASYISNRPMVFGGELSANERIVSYKGAGDIDYRDVIYDTKTRRTRDIDPSMTHGRVPGIVLNSALFSSAVRAYQSHGVESAGDFHDGMKDLRATVRHELGHHLDAISANAGFGEFQRWKGRWSAQAREISGYSGKNSAELFAEAFAAIKYGDATRKSHPAVADLISVIAKYKAHKKGSKS